MLNRQALRLLRAQADLTQEELANRVGVPRTVYARWERPDEPDREEIKALAKALGCKPDDLCREVTVR